MIRFVMLSFVLVATSYFLMHKKTGSAIDLPAFSGASYSAKNCAYYPKPAACVANGCCWTGSCVKC